MRWYRSATRPSTKAPAERMAQRPVAEEPVVGHQRHGSAPGIRQAHHHRPLPERLEQGVHRGRLRHLALHPSPIVGHARVHDFSARREAPGPRRRGAPEGPRPPRGSGSGSSRARAAETPGIPGSGSPPRPPAPPSSRSAGSWSRWRASAGVSGTWGPITAMTARDAESVAAERRRGSPVPLHRDPEARRGLGEGAGSARSREIGGAPRRPPCRGPVGRRPRRRSGPARGGARPRRPAQCAGACHGPAPSSRHRR